MVAGVYGIENAVNGKIYVGSSVNAEMRVSSHIKELSKNKHDNPHLQAAWNKYGPQAFTSKLLLQCDEKFLIFWEQFAVDGFIKSFGRHKLYNICLVVDRPPSAKGRVVSRKTRDKLSIAKKGKPRSASAIEASAAARRGKPAWNRGVKQSENQLEKLREKRLGRKANRITRTRMSAGIKRRRDRGEVVGFAAIWADPIKRTSLIAKRKNRGK